MAGQHITLCIYCGWMGPAMPARALASHVRTGPHPIPGQCPRGDTGAGAQERPREGRIHQPEARAAAKQGHGKKTKSTREKPLSLSLRAALSRYEIISILIG